MAGNLSSQIFSIILIRLLESDGVTDGLVNLYWNFYTNFLILFLESIAYSWIPLLQPITYNLCIEKYSICAINNNFFTYAGAGKQGVL